MSAVHCKHVGTCGTITQPLHHALQVHTRHGPTIQAGKVVMATFMPLVANLAVVSRQVWRLLLHVLHACFIPEGHTAAGQPGIKCQSSAVKTALLFCTVDSRMPHRSGTMC
jgi:hypothetical protein